MHKHPGLTKVLAGAGNGLVWLTLLAPVLFSFVFLARSGRFHFDYLMPAELFLVALAGGLLLIWAALRSKQRRRWIGISLGAAILALVGGQGLAVLTGLASGATQPGGWQFALVLALIALYTLALVVLGVGGILLWRDLRK